MVEGEIMIGQMMAGVVAALAFCVVMMVLVNLPAIYRQLKWAWIAVVIIGLGVLGVCATSKSTRNRAKIVEPESWERTRHIWGELPGSPK